MYSLHIVLTYSNSNEKKNHKNENVTTMPKYVAPHVIVSIVKMLTVTMTFSNKQDFHVDVGRYNAVVKRKLIFQLSMEDFLLNQVM